MKKWNRILGLSLSAALLFGTLAGCSSPNTEKPGKGTATPGPSAAPVNEPPLIETEDVVKRLTGIPSDTTMFTVDGEAVTAEQLYYWLGVSLEDESSAGDIDWTAEEDGKSKADLLLESARQIAQLYRVIENEVTKAGITLSAEDTVELQSQFAQNIADYGEEEYARLLRQMAISDAGLRHMIEVSYLHTPLQESLFGDKGKTPPTAEAVIALAEEQDVMLAKHILIKTVDDSNAPLSEEARSAAKTKAEGLLAQLQAVKGDELAKLFDQLMEENSEDGRGADGKLASPDGYLFGAGQMVQAFEDGTRSLEYGEMSGLVETEYGYHIILRLPPDNAQLRTQWAAVQMRELTDTWMKSVKVVDSPEMAKVDVKDFWEKLVDYRASLEPAPSPTPSATPTPSPTGSK